MTVFLAAIALSSSLRLQADQVRLKADLVRLKPDTTEAAATIKKYCVPCHNDRLKTGGLTLAGVDLEHPAAHAETGEKVIRKLRTGAMPPPGAPRPDATTYNALAAYLETSIDRTALASPRPGKLALVH